MIEKDNDLFIVIVGDIIKRLWDNKDDAIQMAEGLKESGKNILVERYDQANQAVKNIVCVWCWDADE